MRMILGIQQSLGAATGLNNQSKSHPNKRGDTYQVPELPRIHVTSVQVSPMRALRSKTTIPRSPRILVAEGSVGCSADDAVTTDLTEGCVMWGVVTLVEGNRNTRDGDEFRCECFKSLRKYVRQRERLTVRVILIGHQSLGAAARSKNQLKLHPNEEICTK
jgi:hypothetical protein